MSDRVTVLPSTRVSTSTSDGLVALRIRDEGLTRYILSRDGGFVQVPDARCVQARARNRSYSRRPSIGAFCRQSSLIRVSEVPPSYHPVT